MLVQPFVYLFQVAVRQGFDLELQDGSLGRAVRHSPVIPFSGTFVMELLQREALLSFDFGFTDVVEIERGFLVI